MTYWWNEIGDRISLFNLADICPKGLVFYPKSWDRKPSLGKKLSLSSLFFSIGFGIFSIKS